MGGGRGDAGSVSVPRPAWGLHRLAARRAPRSRMPSPQPSSRYIDGRTAAAGAVQRSRCAHRAKVRRGQTDARPAPLSGWRAGTAPLAVRGTGPHGRVFVGEKGGPLRALTVYKYWSRARTRVGLPEGFRLHDL